MIPHSLRRKRAAQNETRRFSTVKQSFNEPYVKLTRVSFSTRDIVLIVIGVVFGTIISLRFSSSDLPFITSQYSHRSTSNDPSQNSINSYNSRFVTHCPHSQTYSIGKTKLVCGRTCNQNYTLWGAPGAITATFTTDDDNILQMKSHSAPYLVSKQPYPIDILDVGANTGMVTAAILSQRKGHRVLAVEPVEKNLNQICKISQLNYWLNSPLLTLVHAAASDRIGSKTMYIRIGRADNSAFTKEAATKVIGGSTRAEEIFMLDGDGLLKETGFKPRIIKVDTQGHELFVLRGLKNFLKNAGKGEVIVMAERHLNITKAVGVDISDLYELMVEELGYSVTCSRGMEYYDDGKVANIVKGEGLSKETFVTRPGCEDVYYVRV